MEKQKLLQRAEHKSKNKFLEHISQKKFIHQVELSTILGPLETSYNNVSSLFSKLYDILIFTQEIKYKLSKFDEDLKASAQELQLDLSLSSIHFNNIRFLTDIQVIFPREEVRIRSTLIDIQNMILPNMDALQKNIAHSKTLIHDNNFSIADHMIELSTKVQVALHTCKVLQENWEKTFPFIIKVHSYFLSHFAITM